VLFIFILITIIFPKFFKFRWWKVNLFLYFLLIFLFHYLVEIVFVLFLNFILNRNLWKFRTLYLCNCRYRDIFLCNLTWLKVLCLSKLLIPRFWRFFWLFFRSKEVDERFRVCIGRSWLKVVRKVESLVEMRTRIRLSLHQALRNSILALTTDLMVSKLIHHIRSLSFVLTLTRLFRLLLYK